LSQKQGEHVNGLLASRLDASWHESVRRIGVLHHSLGIDPSWVAGAYILYWRHWQRMLQAQVPEADRDPLRDTLFRLLTGDLMIQMDGYARASRETDAERLTLFQILMGVLAAPHGDERPRLDGLLSQICQALPRKSAKISFAGYAMIDALGESLRPECLAGLPVPIQQIPKTAGDPCWRALEMKQTVIQSVNDPRAPEWIRSLNSPIAELGCFPFGTEGLRGVGLIGVRETGYFQRVESMYFDAFTKLGDLVLQLRNQSLRDPLTGLPNRALFLDRLHTARKQTLRQERLLGVALLDLDGFKQVNDRLGHAAGDRLLQAVVQRLGAKLRAGDTLARLGGDEFGLLLPNLERLDDLEGVCERLLAAVRKPVELDGGTIVVSASLGLTLFPLDEGDADTLIRHADMALYAAKGSGRDQYRLHSFVMDEALQQEVAQSALLEQALKNDWLVLHYQPIVANAGGVTGVEALIRLQHPNQGLLMPAAFFPALDHPRLARPIGRFVLDSAFQQAARWQEMGLRLRVAVNISTRYLLDSRFPEDLHEAMTRYPTVAPEQIEIEITESAPLLDMEAAQTIFADCRKCGLRIGLDDFGTGNASLSYLQKLPVDTIKIDQSFVHGMIEDPKDLAIVAAVITASRMLSLEVVAEGVESRDLAELLMQLGCSHLQGYYFTPALPAVEIPGWIDQFRPVIQTHAGGISMDVLPPILEGQALRVKKFLTALHGENPFPAHVVDADAEAHCHLGLWLRGEGALHFGASPKFSHLLVRHERIHHLARAAKSFLDSGDVEGAMHQGNLLELENRLLLSELLTMTRQS